MFNHYEKEHLTNNQIIRCDICDEKNNIWTLQEEHVKNHNMDGFCPFCLYSYNENFFYHLDKCKFRHMSPIYFKRYFEFE